VFTEVGTGVQHTVGEAFTSTVRFDPDSPDTQPDPRFGRYTYITWVAPSTTSIPFNLTGGLPSSQIRITAEVAGTNTWRVEDALGLGRFLSLSIDFPPGTFATDALPTTLDLSLATGRREYRLVDQTQNLLVGNITGLTVRQVPEPTAALLWLGLSFALLRGK
jgi:hypothetical protein